MSIVGLAQQITGITPLRVLYQKSSLTLQPHRAMISALLDSLEDAKGVHELQDGSKHLKQ
jgi:hypothetical protein